MNRTTPKELYAITSSKISTRNITLIICSLFALSAFGLSRLAPHFLIGLAGWIFAAIQTFRHDSLKNAPEPRSRGHIVDIVLTVVVTIILSSLGYAMLDFSRMVSETADIHVQSLVFELLVLMGGWALGWVQSIRRIRLAITFARGSS